MRRAKGFKGRYFTLAAIAATVSSVQIHAQNTQAIQLHKIVVSAANTEQDEEDVTDDITVITADEIQERGYLTLKDALASVPGLTFTSNGGFGQPTAFYLRGINSDHTLLLIDGIRANDITGLNGPQYELYSLANVERIEIVRGPQSGIWGGDATAGVINIVTKSAKGERLSLSAKGGSYDTKSLSLVVGDRLGAFDYTLSLAQLETKGFSAAEPGQRSPLYGQRGDDLGWEEDPYTNRSIGLKVGYDLTSRDRLEASVEAVDADIHYDSIDFVTGATVDAPDGPYTTNRIRNRFYRGSYIRTDGDNRAELFYRVSTFNRTQYGGYSGHLKESGFKDRFDYLAGSFFQAGLGYQGFHQGVSAGAPLNRKYANRYLFASNHNTLFDGKTIVSEAVRYDNYSSFENKLTYKAGLKQYLYGSLFVAANYATAYNVPTLYRLYDSWVGNADLQPESSRGYDIAFGYGDRLKLLYYSQKIDRLIDYDYGTWQYYNVDGRSTFKGVEVQYSQPLFEAMRLDLGYTRLLEAENENGALPRRAKRKFDYAITWYPTEEHTVNLNGYYVGERYDDAAETVQTGKYNVTNLSLRHNFAKGYTGEIEVRNLFDRFYQEVDGYATAGRSLFVGIRAKY
ncbi:TonB-dependent receptor plug domain-containing protein [Hydrogenimonas sp.]